MKMKKALAGTAVALAAGAMALALTACGESKPAENANSNTGSAVVSGAANVVKSAEKAVNEIDEAVNEVQNQTVEPAVDEAITIAADALLAPDVEIAYGDYEGMKALASEIQNGEADGKVVRITGDVSHFGSGMSYSIVEADESGSGNIGTVFVIEGIDKADEEKMYPADKARATVTGIVKLDDNGLSHSIHTLLEFVEIQA